MSTSETCCARLAGNAGPKKSPSGHHRTTLSGYIFATKAHIDNRKKNLLSSNISSTYPHNMAALLHGIQQWASAKLCDVEQRVTEGGTYVRQGDHHVVHWPTFQYYMCFACMLLSAAKFNVIASLVYQRCSYIYVVCFKCLVRRYTLLSQSVLTTIVLRPFVRDYPDEPVPEETLTHPPS